MPGSLIVYGLMALAVLGIIGGFTYKVHHAGYEEGVAEVRKELQPKLDACTTSLEAQEKAVQALKAAGDAKVAAATKGLQKATQEARGAKNEAARLRSLAAPKETTACPAAEAVSEIRKGLK